MYIIFLSLQDVFPPDLLAHQYLLLSYRVQRHHLQNNGAISIFTVEPPTRAAFELLSLYFHWERRPLLNKLENARKQGVRFVYSQFPRSDVATV